MAAFALAALVLAVTGIYAVVTYSVSQRGREVGVRLALGATTSSVARLLMGQCLRFVLIGLAVGLGLALGVTRLVSGMLFGLAATDVATYCQIAAVVATVSLLACAIPTASVGRQVTSVLKAE